MNVDPETVEFDSKSFAPVAPHLYAAAELYQKFYDKLERAA